MIKDKIKSWEESSYWCEKFHSQGKKVVFTNGCFDILHRGHVTYLAKAASEGDFLVVGVNSDASVRRLDKGANRPVNDEESRALIVASLEAVDLVIVFEKDTPKELIEFIEPSILVKGADYDAKIQDPKNPKYIVGSNEMREIGGKVMTIPLEEGYSTTGLIQKLK